LSTAVWPGGEKLTGYGMEWFVFHGTCTTLTSPTASPDSAFCGSSRSSPSAEPGLPSHSISPPGSQVPSATVHCVAYGKRAPSPELNFCRERRGEKRRGEEHDRYDRRNPSKFARYSQEKSKAVGREPRVYAVRFSLTPRIERHT